MEEQHFGHAAGSSEGDRDRYLSIENSTFGAEGSAQTRLCDQGERTVS